MYRIETHTKKFDTDSKDDMKEYDTILSNPLVSVVQEKKEKQTTKHFDDEGKPTAQDDKVVLVVTWTEKILL